MNFTTDEKSGLTLISKIAIGLAGIVIGLAITRFFFIPYIVSENSMEPNLKTGTKIVILKHFSPKRGDIILFYSPNDPDKTLLKRIICSEDDMIEIKNKIIYINNKKASFKWKTESKDRAIFPLTFSTRDNLPAIKVKRKEYFVMADHFDRGYDSRTFGVIKKDLIIGKLFYKFD